MHKKFEINPTKIKGGCQSGSKVVTHNSKSDLPLTESARVTLEALVVQHAEHHVLDEWHEKDV